ncbi:unnamed protein product, partial [Mesorhabditis belari]|uniref:Serpentine Receptor, class H n=1 Tax=Mesorhabditis belari TaxID=2138241 RepID=A0AAF3EGU0_9BILA
MIIDVSLYEKIHYCFFCLGVLCLPLNVYGHRAIRKATPKRMQSYRYCLSGYQICCLSFDLFAATSITPIACFPAKCAFSLGLASFLGISLTFQGVIACFWISLMLSFLGLAILQRQQSILPDDHWLSFSAYPKFQYFIGFLFLFVHPITPASIFAYFLVTSDVPRGVREALQDYPALVNCILQPTAFCMDSSWKPFNIYPPPLFYFSFILFVSGLLMVPTYMSLYQQRKIMSAKTLKLQKKWLYNLNVQFGVFSMVFVVPVTWFGLVFFLSIDDIAGLNIIPTIMASLHGTINTIVLFTLYESYQKFAIDELREVLREIRRLFFLLFFKSRKTEDIRNNRQHSLHTSVVSVLSDRHC